VESRRVSIFRILLPTCEHCAHTRELELVPPLIYIFLDDSFSENGRTV
jgi:hypothetical protein